MSKQLKAVSEVDRIARLERAVVELASGTAGTFGRARPEPHWDAVLSLFDELGDLEVVDK